MAGLLRSALAVVLALRTAEASTSLLRAVPVAAGTDATTEAIEALDTDRSGKVEKSEVEAFAKSQGLSPDQVRAEFRSLDTNGDGELEANEISSTLSGADAAPAPKAAAVSRAPTVAAATVPDTKAAAIAPHATPVALAAPALPDGTTGSGFSRQALELDAQQHAGKALAEVFARTAAKALESRTQDAQKAADLEAAARNLRGQMAEIRRSAVAQTVKAAQDAVAGVLHEAEGNVRALEQEASEAEAQAAQRRAQAKEAMEKAMAAQASMAASVQQLRGQEAV